MRMNFLVLLFACMPLAAQVSPVAFSESKDVVPAFDSSGAITLPAARMQLDLSYSKGKKGRFDLSVVYDPQNKHYLWRLANDFLEEREKYSRVYADTGGLFDFLSSSDILLVKVFTSRADSLEAAESAALNEIQQGLASIEHYVPPAVGPSKWPWDYRQVNVPLELSCFPPRANCPHSRNTIVSIGKQGSNWRLVLRDRWEGEVILGPNFTVVSGRQLTQPKK